MGGGSSANFPTWTARLMETPSFAVEGAVKEMVRMGEPGSCSIWRQLLTRCGPGIRSHVDKAAKIEETMNEYEKQMAEYLAQISKGSLTEHQRLVVNDLFYTVSDIERISDHCDNIAELAEKMIQEGLSFSDMAMEGFEKITALTIDSVKAAVLARETEKNGVCAAGDSD